MENEEDVRWWIIDHFIEGKLYLIITGIHLYLMVQIGVAKNVELTKTKQTEYLLLF